MSKHKQPERLMGSNFRILSKDEEGKRFIPYCDFGFHQGVCTSEKYKECEIRHCTNFYRLYISR